MVFITAFLWGVGISLGMCVGLVTWWLLRPLVNKDDAYLAALQERNKLTVNTNEYLDRIADALEKEPWVPTCHIPGQ